MLAACHAAVRGSPVLRKCLRASAKRRRMLFRASHCLNSAMAILSPIGDAVCRYAMPAKKLVIFGLLGTQLDRGTGPARWESWRPTVSLCQQDDLLVCRLEL